MHSFLDVIYGAMSLYRTHTGRHPKKNSWFLVNPFGYKVDNTTDDLNLKTSQKMSTTATVDACGYRKSHLSPRTYRTATTNRFFNIPKTSFWIPFFAKKATPTIDHPYKIKSSSDLLFNSANIIPFQNGLPLLLYTTRVWMDCSFWARVASFFAAFLLLSFTERGETQIIRTICYCAEAVEKVIGTQRGPFLEPFRSLTLIRALP